MIEKVSWRSFRVETPDKFYDVIWRPKKGWSCSCTYYTKTGRVCSHIREVVIDIGKRLASDEARRKDEG